MKERANYRMYTICGFGLTTTDVNSGDAHICTVPCMVVLAHIKQRYRELYKELAQGQDQPLVPIIMYLDGTAIDSMGHIEICPVSFTTSLFNEKHIVMSRHGIWWVMFLA